MAENVDGKMRDSYHTLFIINYVNNESNSTYLLTYHSIETLDNISSTAVQNTEITYSEEKDEKIEQAAKEVKEKSKKTINVIKKYYPEQYEKIS